MSEQEILSTDNGEDHFCFYSPTLMVDDEGYLYLGGKCEECGKEIKRDYNIKLKQ